LLVPELHLDVRHLGLILLQLAGFFLGRQRPVQLHDVREAGPNCERGDVTLNQHGGSWRNLRGVVGHHPPQKGDDSSSRSLWELALPFKELDEVSGGVAWHGRIGQGERLCLGSSGV
jgi:hypothetical protein